MYLVATESRKFSTLKEIAETNKKGKKSGHDDFEAGTRTDSIGPLGTDYRPKASIFGLS